MADSGKMVELGPLWYSRQISRCKVVSRNVQSVDIIVRRLSVERVHNDKAGTVL